MEKGKKKLIFKAFLFSLPVLIFTGAYLWLDPFKVLYKYENYMPLNDQYVSLNRDFVSTEVFINNYPKYKYDSFIFGSSRSLFYEAADWMPYIKTDSNKIFHFDASRESIYGIHLKIKYLEKQKVPVKNCLLILDYATLLNTTNTESILYSKHYLLSGENKLKFQFLFFKAFLDRRFLFIYLDFCFTGKIKPYMKMVLGRRIWNYNPVNNELQRKTDEEAIKNGTYYRKKIKAFRRKNTSTKVSPQVISTMQLKLLNDINTTFSKNATACKVIISPGYNQVYLNPADVIELKEIFGASNVFDFSGKNNFTEDYHNFYDRSHYRPSVSREILKIIYSNDNQR